MITALQVTLYLIGGVGTFLILRRDYVDRTVEILVSAFWPLLWIVALLLGAFWKGDDLDLEE